jgi:cold-inducible RNA-binding protein
MAKKLYVGNLPYTYTADQLKSLFAEIGTVLDATVITDKVTGRSRGFGFAEMEDADADKAVEQFNGKEVDGRKITVNEARPMAERGPRAPRRSY